jgi:hypothetical protein
MPATQKAEIRRIEIQCHLGQKAVRPYLKNNLKAKRAGSMTEVVGP